MYVFISGVKLSFIVVLILFISAIRLAMSVLRFSKFSNDAVGVSCYCFPFPHGLTALIL
jgi:hypothetical protein